MRSAHGKNAKGSKINSIEALSFPGSYDSSSSGHSTNTKLLISSADSRIRLYNFRSQLLDAKFKGHSAEELPIRACASDDGQFIVSGSEDRGAFIWSLDRQPLSRDKPSQRAVEYFEASGAKTTSVVFAPTTARVLLARSEDPIYDLCNPPPVTLVSREESVTSSRPGTESGSVNDNGGGSSNVHGGSGPASPTTPKQPPTSTPRIDASPKKAPESEAYKARLTHPNGHIIVTASSNGSIRVYRQDCAFRARARQASDLWETGSMWSSKAQGQGKKPSAVYMARAMSSHSKTSGGGRKRAGSQASAASAVTQPAGERILSWRQGVSSSTPSLSEKGGRQGSGASEVSARDPLLRLRNRSVSPRKSVGSVIRELRGVTPPAAAGRPDSQVDGPADGLVGLGLTASPENVLSVRPLVRSGTDSTEEDAKAAIERAKQRAREVDAETKVKENPLWLQGGKSFMFWNPGSYPSHRSSAEGKQGHLAVPGGGGESSGSGRPELQSRESRFSTVSKLSSEEPTPDEGDEEEERPVCKKCNWRGFRRSVDVRGHGVLVCERCGREVG